MNSRFRKGVALRRTSKTDGASKSLVVVKGLTTLVPVFLGEGSKRFVSHCHGRQERQGKGKKGQKVAVFAGNRKHEYTTPLDEHWDADEQ